MNNNSDGLSPNLSLIDFSTHAMQMNGIYLEKLHIGLQASTTPVAH
ncbi:MAG TPA: hypothetical protein VGK06_12285 [Methanosarcina sp.]|jgi:hypothetical protein